MLYYAVILKNTQHKHILDKGVYTQEGGGRISLGVFIHKIDAKISRKHLIVLKKNIPKMQPCPDL